MTVGMILLIIPVIILPGGFATLAEATGTDTVRWAV